MPFESRHNSTPDLSPIQQAVLTALAAGQSISAAARAAGVHRATIHNWLKEKAFQIAFDTSRQEYVESLRDELRELSALALASLRTLLDDPDTSPTVRLRAALAVLNRPVYPKPGWVLPEPIGTHAEETYTREIAEIDAEFQAYRQEKAMRDDDLRAGGATPESHARNALCKCGSGKKYKRCCGVNAPPVLSQPIARRA